MTICLDSHAEQALVNSGPSGMPRRTAFSASQSQGPMHFIGRGAACEAVPPYFPPAAAAPLRSGVAPLRICGDRSAMPACLLSHLSGYFFACRVSIMTIVATDGTYHPTLDQDLKVPPLDTCPPARPLPACPTACLPAHQPARRPPTCPFTPIQPILTRRRSAPSATRQEVVPRQQRAAGLPSSLCAAPAHATPPCCRPTTPLGPLTSPLVRASDAPLQLPCRRGVLAQVQQEGRLLEI